MKLLRTRPYVVGPVHWRVYGKVLTHWFVIIIKMTVQSYNPTCKYVVLIKKLY